MGLKAAYSLPCEYCGGSTRSVALERCQASYKLMVSGASMATSAIFVRITIPEMLKLNYDKCFAAGVVTTSGILASLIPPSAILVIHVIIVEQCIGALVMADFIQ